MLSTGNRRVIVAVLLATTMVLAGCSGGGGPTATETPTDESTDEPTDEPTDGTPGENAESEVTREAGVEAVSLDYDWQEGESYTYESEAAQGAASQYSWDVTDVGSAEVTAALTSSFGTQSQTSSITGPQRNIFGGDSENPPQALTFRVLQIPKLLVQDHTLESGNSWTVSSSDLQVGGSGGQDTQQAEVSVTGTSQVQGEQCYDIEATTQNESVSGCVKEEWPFALSMTITAELQGQTQTNTYTLVEYDRP